MGHLLSACVLMVSPEGRPRDLHKDALKALEKSLPTWGIELTSSKWLSDEAGILKKEIRLACDQQNFNLLLTLGGLGLGPRDRVAACTAELLDRDLPGLAELIRLACMQKSRLAALSGGKAGLRHSTLVLNLGSSETAVLEALTAALPLFPYIFEEKLNPWV